MVIEIQNGIFILNYQNKLISPIKILDYGISTDKWNHIAISYRKKKGLIKIFLNCEEVVNFKLTLTDEIGIKGDINFGNAKLEAEVTEIRIWNHEIPLKFIKENYKSPLPIIFENKQKLRMKINKQEENRRKTDFKQNPNQNRFQSFAFGGNRFGSVFNGIQLSTESSRKVSVPTFGIKSNHMVSSMNMDNANVNETLNLDISAIPEDDNDKNIYNNIFEFKENNIADESNILPSMKSILEHDRKDKTTIYPKLENSQIDNYDFKNDDFNFDK